ncbi:MAG: sigma-70 family RNA polymerase sigma factor [Calditrichaeota bacterium]|nr:sigma-70 family RNA polymerase sigma factor [Calditrichota bacterium]
MNQAFTHLSRLNDDNQRYRALHVRLMTVAKQRLWGRPLEVIEDIVQSTILVCVEKTVFSQPNPEAFALLVLRNKIGNYLQGDGGRSVEGIGQGKDEDGDRTTAFEPVSDAPGPDLLAILSEEKDALLQCLQTLGVICRVIVMGTLQGLDVQEILENIAQKGVRMTPGTFYTRRHRCLKDLKLCVAGKLDRDW